jgi:hypothetical protein
MSKKSSSDDWKQQAKERLKDKQQSGNRFKLSEGENCIRILPAPEGAKNKAPFFEFLIHRNVGPKKRFLRCGKNIRGEGSCWLCDKQIPKLLKSDSKSQRKLADALTAKEQFSVQIAQYDGENEKFRGPFLWSVPTGGGKSMAANILRLFQSNKRDYVSAEKGYNINIERTGTGLETRYTSPTSDEEPSEVPEAIIEKLKPLSKVVGTYDEDEMKNAYFGKDADDSDDDEDDEPKKKKKGGDEDEEESEKESEEEESEEEEEESPKKKKKKKDEEEEEEESEEEEEEEDESPKKKKKKAADEDEEEEEEEESEDEEEEEESPKAKKKKKKDEDEEEAEEEEEEEESEEEEEEETPKKKKKKKDADEEEESEPEEPEEEEEEEEEEAPKKRKKKK